LVAKYLPQLPAWPQLPKRSPKENMYLQFSEGFPGLMIEGDKPRVKRTTDFDTELERLLTTAEDEIDAYHISADCAAGLHALPTFLSHPETMKGQITGPVSFGLCITDINGRGIVYDETLAEAAARLLRLKAKWQENFLRRITRTTIIFVDEPYLTSLGTAFVALSNERVARLLEEVLGGLSGVKGIHCCGSTDWSLLLSAPIDVLSFDAYNYADSLACYPANVKAFLEKGGNIAWGIVPNDEDALADESLSSLYDRFGEVIAPFTRDGISFRQITAQSLLTPSCGLASLSTDAAVQALELLKGLSDKIRSRLSP
jgi:methionine synthase II (cobalamin-independent)